MDNARVTIIMNCQNRLLALLLGCSLSVFAAERQETVIADNWKFTKGVADAHTQWQKVRVPHDWAIYGPFDRSNDLQVVAVTQNLETEKTEKTGRTGGLPYVGKGEYRTTFTIDSVEGRSFTLLFDGAMSNAHVKVNGKEVGFWAYGYNAFHFNIDDAVKVGENELQVNLENYSESSRWYPGAGLYRSVWNKEDETLHVLPHWNWSGREGEVTPVFVYTSYPKAELFINGVSQGVREKNDSTLLHRYRLMWNETRYEPGELKVVAYDANGKKADEKIVRTAGKPHHLVLPVNRSQLVADGEDLTYVTVQVADKNGNIVPTDDRLVKFTVSGAGTFEATANGDATCIMPFQNPEMKLFSGALTAIVRSSEKSGILKFTAKAAGVKSATLEIPVK